MIISGCQAIVISYQTSNVVGGAMRSTLSVIFSLTITLLFWIISTSFHPSVSPLNQTVSRNDCNFKKLLIVGQILSQSSIGNIEGIVQRTCILISGCKGWSKTWDNYYFLLHVIISRCHRQSKEGQAYSDSFKGKKRFLTLWNWNSRIESICLKFDSWLFAICKPQQPSSNKWPWMEQLKCYILKLIVTILPKKKITLFIKFFIMHVQQ